jgi:hypothetical protein
VLLLGFGWSLWFHLFVRYPKTLSAGILALVLSSVPVENIGIGTGKQSVGRVMLCTLTADTPAGFCTGPSIGP